MKKLEASAGATLALFVGLCAAPCRAQDPQQEPNPAAAQDLAASSDTQAAPDFTPAPNTLRGSSSFDNASLLDVPRDERRTLSAFPKNLGRNFIGVFSGQNLVPLVAGAGATVLASAFDARTQHALDGACQPCGSVGATAGGSAMVPLVGALFVAGRFAPEGRFRAASYDFAQAMIVNAAYTGLLKYTVQRPRPDGSDNLSFPSGHTSTAFSMAAVASHHYGWKVGVPAYLVATGIGLSRIESDRHHLSDVLAGATLGLIVGRTVTRLDGERPEKKRVFSVGPATDPQGGGIGLGVSASW